MHRGGIVRRARGLVLAAAVAGCAGGPRPKDGPVHVNDLVGAVERVYVDAELSKERADAAYEALRTIAATDFRGDPAKAFAEFVEAIERSEKQAKRLRDAVDPMKEEAQELFERWEKDLEAFASESLRERSRERLAGTRERYGAVVAAVDPAQAAYDHFNKTLRDHALFLSHDFNPAALAALQQDVRALQRTAGELRTALDGSMAAARAYIESAALPVAGASSVSRVSGARDERPGRVEEVRGGREE